MRYLSLFSGVEAASAAWMPLGWEPVAFCENDEFPASVLAARFPDVPNLGDVRKGDWYEFHERNGIVDVLVGGSPCTSYSIAGNRLGRAGESGLMAEYIRAVRELVRASGGQSPRYIVWENVPGALSAERGAAFGQLLAELGECGYGLAWRVLDAQYARVPLREPGRFFGPVAQRRRRVFLVGVLGCPDAAEILFERSSLRGDNPPNSSIRQIVAADPREGAHGGRCGRSVCIGSVREKSGVEEDVSGTLMGGHEHPIVVIDRAAFNQGRNALYPPHVEETDLMDCIVARGPHAVCFRTEGR